LLTADDISELQQKCGFYLRKPLFYPLNYGDNDILDFRFSIADSNNGRALQRPLETGIAGDNFNLRFSIEVSRQKSWGISSRKNHRRVHVC